MFDRDYASAHTYCAGEGEFLIDGAFWDCSERPLRKLVLLERAQQRFLDLLCGKRWRTFSVHTIRPAKVNECVTLSYSRPTQHSKQSGDAVVCYHPFK